MNIKKPLMNVQILIEYDGRQHYIPIEPLGGEEELKKIKQHDEIKNEYANNNITLLRIPYWDIKNIEKTLRSNIWHL